MRKIIAVKGKKNSGKSGILRNFINNHLEGSRIIKSFKIYRGQGVDLDNLTYKEEREKYLGICYTDSRFHDFQMVFSEHNKLIGIETAGDKVEHIKKSLGELVDCNIIICTAREEEEEEDDNRKKAIEDISKDNNFNIPIWITTDKIDGRKKDHINLCEKEQEKKIKELKINFKS